MEKDKYDFITELIVSPKLSIGQREHILLLTSKEIKNDKLNSINFEKRLASLEERILINDNFEVTEFNSTIISKDDINNSLKSIPYLYPQSLYKFLYEYNQNNILRSTCHEIDSNALKEILDFCETDTYNFNIHLNKIKIEFDKLSQKHFANKSTKALIRGYLTGCDYKNQPLANGWSSDKIKMNWSDSDLLAWASKYQFPPNSTEDILFSNKNVGFHFNGFTSSLFCKRIQTFRDLVLHFKSLFHIRSGNSLKSILEQINKQKFKQDNIEFIFDSNQFPDNIEIFTDVDKVIQAYIKIVELINEQQNTESNPIVRLSFYERANSTYFSINHINSTYRKTITNTIERTGQTYSNLIKNQLNGICNFYVIANFGNNEIAEINLWNGKERFAKKEGFEIFNGGVEHIFEFCKK